MPLQQVGDHVRARSLLEEGLLLTKAVGNSRGIAACTHVLAWLAGMQGELERARMWWEESLSLFKDLGDQATVALILTNLAHLAVQQAEPERAKALFLEGMAIGQHVRYAVIAFTFLEGMVDVAMLEGDPISAARFLAAVDEARTISGEVTEPWKRAHFQQVIEVGRAHVGEDAWEAAWQEGRAIGLETAVGLARAYATRDQCAEGVAPA
jgi:hypothetical protein